MKELVPGHKYTVANFESKEEDQTIQFIHKEPTGEPDNSMKTISDGTTNEELICVLIERMEFLNGKFPCQENEYTIMSLKQAWAWQHNRTLNRERRNVEGKHTA
jgi:hypothetical protein